MITSDVSIGDFLTGCKLVIDGNCAGGLGLKTADSNISCVKGTIPCRQSVYNYWYTCYWLWQCSNFEKYMQWVTTLIGHKFLYLQRVGALVCGSGANEPICTPLTTPLIITMDDLDDLYGQNQKQ